MMDSWGLWWVYSIVMKASNSLTSQAKKKHDNLYTHTQMWKKGEIYGSVNMRSAEGALLMCNIYDAFHYRGTPLC